MKKAGLLPNEELKEIQKDIRTLQDSVTELLKGIKGTLVPELGELLSKTMRDHEKKFHTFRGLKR